MLYIGVDLGTSAVKLLLMDGSGTIQKIVSREYPISFPHPGWSEQNPEDWLRQTLDGIRELTAQCDIISLHCAVTDETREMVDGAFLARMKPNSILVNCGRGDLVDNQALRKALIDGTIRGAALDTIFPEPTPGDHPLVDLPPEVRDRVVYSSHLGGSSGGAFAKAHLTMWTNAQHILNGERPTNVVNGL